MFGAYRIGANTPAKFQIPTKVRDSVNDVRGSWEGVYDLAADTPNMVKGTMKVANFLTGQEQGNAVSYYKQGAAVGGPWIATPAFLKDEMLRLLGEAKSLNNDIASSQASVCALPGGGRDFGRTGNTDCAKLNRFALNTWSPFLFELKDFVTRHRSWHSRLWGALYTEIQEYRKRLIGLREQAISFGTSVTAPAPKLPPPPAIEELGNLVRTVLYFLVGGVIVWILFNTVLPMFKGRASVAA